MSSCNTPESKGQVHLVAIEYVLGFPVLLDDLVNYSTIMAKDFKVPVKLEVQHIGILCSCSHFTNEYLMSSVGHSLSDYSKRGKKRLRLRVGS